MILGIDTSHYEPMIDWEAAKGDGVAWMYTKASQGSSFVDHSDGAHSKAARAAGVLAAFYHFYDASVSGQVQADLFLKSIAGLKFDLPHFLDWEDSSVAGQDLATQIANAQPILDAMEKNCGRPPIIYMGRDLAEQLVLPASFARYPAVFARYMYNPTTAPIAPLPPWRFLFGGQWTDSAKIAGVPAGHTVDADEFYGTRAQLQAFVS